MLDSLIEMDSPIDIIEEVKTIAFLIFQHFNLELIESAYQKTVDLFEGRFAGYRSCNTEYHDLHHTLNTFLAMARIVHGASVEGEFFSEHQVIIGLVSALLHDAGYIQEKRDINGTGAKHTVSHIHRSMDFLRRHHKEFGLSQEDAEEGASMILCTDLSMDISAIRFSSNKVKRLGKMLGTADLLAQMADRAYLEKLLFLYHEFREADIGDYECEIDLLKKTIDFFGFISKRFKFSLGATDQYMTAHFFTRWKIKKNLYQTAIANQKNYLVQILKKRRDDPRNYLKRKGIVERVRKKYGDR